MNAPTTPARLTGRDAARRFVELLTGDADTALCWRILSDAKDRPPLGNRDGALDEFWDEFTAAQADGFSPFVVVNGGGHRDADIDELRAVFIDADGVSLRGLSWHIRPHFIVRRDAEHFHAYWLVTGMTPAQFRETQRRLAANYGTDKAVSNPSRVMRVPGFRHLKDPQAPADVTLLDLTGGDALACLYQALSLEEIAAGLPDLAREEKSEQASSRRGAAIEIGDLRAVLSHIDPTFADDQARWAGIAKAIRHGQIPVEDADDVDWEDLVDSWCSGALWRERTGDKCFEVPTYRGRDELMTRTADRPRDGADVVGLGTLIQMARAGGYRGPVVSAAHLFGDVQIEGLNDPDTDVSDKYAESPLEPSPDASRPRRSFTPRSEAEQDAQPEPEWLIPGVIQAETLNLFYGPEASFKSFVVLDLVLSAAAGVPWAADECGTRRGYSAPRPLTAIYIAGEGAHGIETLRRPAWRAAHSITELLPFFTIGEMPRFGDGDEVARLIQDIERAGIAPDVVVVDTVARAMVGMDENSAKDAGVLTAALDRVKRRLGCAVIAVHHSGKDERKGARGSSAIPANFDARFAVTAERASRTVTITNEKQKDGPEWTHSVTMAAETVRLDARGRAETSLVFRRVPPPATNGRAARDAARIAEVRAALARCDGATRMVTTHVLADTVVNMRLAREENADVAAKASALDLDTMVKNEKRNLQRQAKRVKKRGGGTSPGILSPLVASDPDDRDLLWSLPSD